MWIQFMDMNSGGGRKEPHCYIYIEAKDEKEATVIFYNRFGHNPNRVTCTCCGEDYSITEYESLEAATGYERNDYIAAYGEDYDGSGPYGELESLESYETRKDVLVIRADEIKPEEREGDVPNQGYVWVD